jgi:hypothetical protein
VRCPTRDESTSYETRRTGEKIESIGITPIVVSGPRFWSAGQVAPAAADRERHLELALVGEMRELELRVQDLEIGGRLDVGGRDGACTLLRKMHLDLGRVAVEAADELLEVEDDVGDVLADARQRRELVGDALDLDGRDGRALERREQHPPERVAEGVAEAAVERLDREAPRALVGVLGDDPGRCVKQRGTGGHGILSGGSGGNRLEARRRVGRVTSSRARRSVTPGPACRSRRARAT